MERESGQQAQPCAWDDHSRPRPYHSALLRAALRSSPQSAAHYERQEMVPFGALATEILQLVGNASDS